MPEFVRRSTTVRKDSKLQIAWGVVLEPKTAANPDSQGDWYDAAEIEKAAHGFLAKIATGQGGADYMHGEDLIGVVVESYITTTDGWLGDQWVPEGSWVAGIHYPDPDVWDLVEKGELAAFSVGGSGTRIYGG